MAHSTEQKIKLLVLYDLLCRLTDEDHALHTDEIIALLAEKKIAVSRKILLKDIALLNEYGYEVLSYKKRYHYYYVVNRHFDSAEIAFLADAVQASKLSVTQKQTLTNKLLTTMGDFQADELKAAARFGTMPKRNNKYIIYTIDTVKQAIADNKQVSFKYYSLDYQKNRVYRNDGERYVVNPLVVVWNKDNYYLVCYDDKHDGTATYRIDRMAEAIEETTDRVYRKEFDEFDIEKYRQRVFSMFGGEEQEVGLLFDSAMLDDVFDKFGEEVNIVKVDDVTYQLKVPIQVSKTFFAWVVGTQGKMKILAPQTVCEQFNEFVGKIKEEY
ncbi:MAG: WYL domain-containing protein [Clostridia bacterium]|nr:WYL domain-containing protein [Clostridia bacterium]